MAAAQQESAGIAAMYNNIGPNSLISQEQQAMIPLLINQKPRFPDSCVPQQLVPIMSPDNIVNKTKEMYVL